MTTRLPMGMLYGLCYAATPVHAALSRLMHLLRREPAPPKATARERAVQMFDNYSPRFQYRHTVPEIMELFRSEGYTDLRDVTLDNEARHMLAVLGRKKPRGREGGGDARRRSRRDRVSRWCGSRRRAVSVSAVSIRHVSDAPTRLQGLFRRR